MNIGCTEDTEIPFDAPLAGGKTTILDRSSGGFTQPAPNLNEENLALHLDGDLAFEATFVSAPSEVNPGLGTLFNSRSCNSCHIKNGRGLPVVGNGPLGSQLLVRVSLAEGEEGMPGGPIPVPGLGGQLQDHATVGNTPEVTILLKWLEQEGAYNDGTTYLLRHPEVTITLPDGSPLPSDVMTSLRLPPPVMGLGLLEAISEETLLLAADPDDANNDGISGRPNRVWNAETSTTVIGRFSWKANNPTLRQQAAGAYVSDMGVTNPIFDRGESPTDIDDETLDAATIYTQTLAVPMRTQYDDPIVKRGEQLFEESECASCHLPTIETGDHPIPALRNQLIHPYTDLLLHDMGPDLADGRPDFEATGVEWRTPPLWGIGLTETIMGTAAYLHDGRARTLEEAILWHGGEAEASKDFFLDMNADDREALIQFLLSL